MVTELPFTFWGPHHHTSSQIVCIKAFRPIGMGPVDSYICKAVRVFTQGCPFLQGLSTNPLPCEKPPMPEYFRTNWCLNDAVILVTVEGLLDFICVSSFLAKVFVSFCLFAETLMDTKWATTELAWTAHPETGWEEVSGYDDAMNPIRTYQVCNVRESNQNNWLRSDFIPRKDVLRVYVEMKFTVRDCNSIPNIPGSCKETFNLFYYESDSDSATETSPFWMENPYVKVDTIAPDESFSMLESGRVNTKVRSFGPLSKVGFYLAFQDLGACMSLISVRVFYKKCSTTIANFAMFPETATGAEATSLVIAPGTCVSNALEVSVPLKLYCNGDGEWMVPVGSCTCASGFEPAMKDTQCQGECDIKDTQCQACSPGTFKSKQGEGFCTPCPPNSRTSSGAASLCSCRNGYYRSDTDSPDNACTTVPSAPRSVISNVNETSLVLEWSEPRDSGGRGDIFYNVICKKCLPERGMCSRCDDNVDISPRHLGLTQRRVAVRNLQAHTQYSFEIQAVNGVSNKSPYTPQFSAVNITTNQAAPSAVPTVQLMGATASTMSLSWLPPEKPNGIILDYEIKYHEKDQGEAIAHTMTAQRSSARIEGLKTGTPYVIQVRARTVAGYGRYSSPADFSTNLKSDPKKSLQEQLPLIVGSATASLVFIIAVVVIAIVCLRKQRNGSESEYTEKLQQYITPGMKVYIDPFTYEDPNEAVREFAKEIDISCVKIEEVIGAGNQQKLLSYRGKNASHLQAIPPLVINAVEQDYRLPPPMDCPTALHQLMLDCWVKERNLRPKFSQIVATLDKLIRNAASLKVVTSSTQSSGVSQPLLDRCVPDYTTFTTVGDWLDAIKMSRYRDNFLNAGFASFDLVAQMTAECRPWFALFFVIGKGKTNKRAEKTVCDIIPNNPRPSSDRSDIGRPPEKDSRQHSGHETADEPNTACPGLRWTNRQTDGQTGWGGTVPEREPIGNPSCLTISANQTKTKLACSASN
ncbi:unnamed protein product [Coregonus sp. 'balchen']|nr:unnamed protein product [Coregonus sp. 'balchen']